MYATLLVFKEAGNLHFCMELRRCGGTYLDRPGAGKYHDIFMIMVIWKLNINRQAGMHSHGEFLAQCWVYLPLWYSHLAMRHR